jgi:hypothetical protein
MISRLRATSCCIACRVIVIPAHVTVTGNYLRARGEFSINRDDYRVKQPPLFTGWCVCATRLSSRSIYWGIGSENFLNPRGNDRSALES